MMMGMSPSREVVEDIVLIGGLIVVQLVYAGNSVLLSYLMLLGLNPLTIVIFSTFAAFLVLSPLSVCFERSLWPKKISLKFMTQLILISFGGVTLFQSLFLKGIKLTSPAIATAMPNLAPGLIFVIAAVFGFEKIKFSCMYSKVKIAGTLLCVIGALTMSIMQSTKKNPIGSPTEALAIDQNLFDTDKIIGCLYLLTAVFSLSSTIVLQAWTLVDVPAPMSLCAITSFIGVILTALVQLIQDHKLDTTWLHILSVPDIIGYSLLGGIVSGGCVSFNGWAMKKKGPVLVSMFSPIGTVASVILSFITLGQNITIGSLAGMFLMFTGLYFFLWAKGKEDFSIGDGEDHAIEIEHDVEKPLLS